jgi:hypothetical protein
MLDPDASAASIHSGIIVGFLTSSMRPANIAFANWFAGWVNAGKRLDLAISLGNVQSSEASNFHCATMEGLGERGRAAHTLNGFFFSDLALADFSISPQPELYGWCPNRLGGWLARRYGPLTLAYMVNTQAAKHHLTVQQTRDLGGGMVDAIPEFFASPDGPILLANVDARRKERLDRWAPMPSAPKPSSPTALAGRTAAMMIRSSTGSPGRQNRPRNTPMRWQRICTFR